MNFTSYACRTTPRRDLVVMDTSLWLTFGGTETNSINYCHIFVFNTINGGARKLMGSYCLPSSTLSSAVQMLDTLTFHLLFQHAQQGTSARTQTQAHPHHNRGLYSPVH